MPGGALPNGSRLSDIPRPMPLSERGLNGGLDSGKPDAPAPIGVEEVAVAEAEAEAEADAEAAPALWVSDGCRVADTSSGVCCSTRNGLPPGVSIR